VACAACTPTGRSSARRDALQVLEQQLALRRAEIGAQVALEADRELERAMQLLAPASVRCSARVRRSSGL